jgi:hypothetical protein
MKRELAFHVALLGVAALVALGFYTREDTGVVEKAANVRLWDADSARLTEVRYESEERKVLLVAKSDAQGRYFEGTLDTVDPLPEGHPTLDASGQSKVKKEAKQARFIAVREAERLAKDVAPLMALRRIGKLDAKRDAEFGFDKPEGKLRFKFGGIEQVLLIGGVAPGEEDRYVRYEKSGEIYAISRDVLNRVKYADSRLLEREKHSFDEAQLRPTVRLEKGTRSRELVTVEGKVDGWADSKEPGKLDETAGNWMAGLRRVRISEFVAQPKVSPTAEQLVVRVRYLDKGKELGFLELYNLGADAEPQYLARTEHSRWFFSVLKTSVEQLERDLPSVLK